MKSSADIFIYVFCICIVFSCKHSDTPSHFNVFHYNQPNKITSLDPAFAKSQNNIWACNHLFNGLVQLDDSLNIIPAIARSWEISDDGKKYTFHLRTDVLFHENSCLTHKRKVSANDFKYSLERIIDKKLNSPGSWIFEGKIDSIQPFQVPNDSVFVIRLQKPFLPLMGILTMQYCSVVPSECVEYHGDEFRANPVGTGPFKFKRWLDEQGLFLKKNEFYFEGTTNNLDGVRTSFISDEKIAFLELKNKNVDFISGLESSFANELLDHNGNLHPELQDELKFVKSPYLNTEYFGFNMQLIDSSFLNKNVRKALNYALDKKLMLQSLRNNVGKPATAGFVPRGLPSYDPKRVKGFSYNPKLAASLLKDAGFPMGKGFPELTISTNKDYLDLTTFAASQWEKLGLKIKIDLKESAVLRDGMRKGNIPFFRASWIADYPDAESFLCMFYSKNPAPPNYTRFSSETFDTWYEEAIQEDDILKRYDLYQRMDSLLIEEAPVVFLFYDETALFFNNRIEGVSENGINLLQVKNIQASNN